MFSPIQCYTGVPYYTGILYECTIFNNCTIGEKNMKIKKLIKEREICHY